MVLATDENSEPAAVRIRNVTRNGFELVQVEPANADGVQRAMTVPYLVVQQGTHELPDGTRLLAGTKSVTQQQHGSGVVGSQGWKTLTIVDWPGSSSGGGSILPSAQAFGYDANGNRESLAEGGTTYNYTNVPYSNRLMSTTGPTSKTFTHDAAGNVTNDGIHSYDYDDRGRLVSVDSGVVTYQHNGQGQRVKKDDGSSVTLFA